MDVVEEMFSRKKLLLKKLQMRIMQWCLEGRKASIDIYTIVDIDTKKTVLED